MGKIIAVIIVILAIIGGFYFLGKNNPQPKPQGKNTVIIQNMAFSPASLTVNVGDTVTWINMDSVGHSATADDNSFDTDILSQNQSKDITFSKAGTFSYHCKVHPNMHGTIVVKSSSSMTSPSESPTPSVIPSTPMPTAPTQSVPQVPGY